VGLTDFLFEPNIDKLYRKKDIKGLVKALGYKKDSSIRENAARCLGRINGNIPVESLIATLKDSNTEVRKATVNALGDLKDKRAIEPLIALLKTEFSFLVIHFD